jgi:uncharacterized protein YbjT (DUF2867 family)
MIVVTTPTGTIGSQVLAKLLDIGESVRVIARDPSRLPAGAFGHVEVVEGSHGDPDVVQQAFAGADAVFWVVPPDHRCASLEAAYVDFSRPACEALKAHGVSRVVGISALGRGIVTNAGIASALLAMDDLMVGTGVNYRALTVPSFMDNIAWQTEAIKTKGVFFSPISGDRKLPTCATRDIAARAVTQLTDSSWSGAGAIPLLGPEDLSFNDMARIMSEMLGRPIHFQQITFDDFKATLKTRGNSEAFAQGMVDLMRAREQGLDNAEPRTAQATTPTTFRQWCEEVLKPAVLD